MKLCVKDIENATKKKKKSRNTNTVNKTTGKVKLVMFPLARLSVIVDIDKNRWQYFSQHTWASLRSQIRVYFTQHFFHLFFFPRLYLCPSFHIAPPVTPYKTFCSVYYFICSFLFFSHQLFHLSLFHLSYLLQLPMQTSVTAWFCSVSLFAVC